MSETDSGLNKPQRGRRDELTDDPLGIDTRRRNLVDDLRTGQQPGLDDVVGRGVVAPPFHGGGADVSEPAEGIEIGGGNECECSSAPDLVVDKGDVGDWSVQLVSCGECGFLFGSAVESLPTDEDDA